MFSTRIFIFLEEITIWKVSIVLAKSSVIKYIVKRINSFVSYCKKTALNKIPRGRKEKGKDIW